MGLLLGYVNVFSVFWLHAVDVDAAQFLHSPAIQSQLVLLAFCLHCCPEVIVHTRLNGVVLVESSILFEARVLLSILQGGVIGLLRFFLSLIARHFLLLHGSLFRSAWRGSVFFLFPITASFGLP